MEKVRSIAVIDLKAFYSYVECIDRGLDPWKTPLVVADKERGTNTIVLSVSPFLKKHGVPSRCRIKELPKKFKYVYAVPRMERYLEKSADVISVLYHFVAELESAENVEMQMHHRLAAVLAAVVDDAVALVKALGLRDLRDGLKALCDIHGIALIDFTGAADVLLRHHQNVDRSLGIDVPEGIDVFVLIHLCAGNVPGNDFAEQAVFHLLYPPVRFFR